MNANVTCVACLLNKEEQALRAFVDDEKKERYIQSVLKLLYDHGLKQSSPWLAMHLEQMREEAYGQIIDYAPIKRKYNEYMLTIQETIDQSIRHSDDPIAAGIRYVCAGNYIDFGAMATVDDAILKTILTKAKTTPVDPKELQAFKEDLEKGKEVVYFLDNCGEIVLDKLFIRLLKEKYPHLQIHACVRGKPILNDASMEDAIEVGLTEVAECIDTGAGAPGAVYSLMSDETKEMVKKADVIISKGMGNFEGLHGEGFNPYFLFLCKCELFTRRFGLGLYDMVFVREQRMNLITK
jgi:uncharacterized protein with ATP-grasp and redox domains